MICKWCGAELKPAEKRCSRCGKENPPLSDCGGFYDLVPRAAGGERAAQKSGAGVVLAILMILLALTVGFSLFLIRENRLLKAELEEMEAAAETVEAEHPTLTTDGLQETTLPERNPYEEDMVQNEQEITGDETVATEPSEEETEATESLEEDPTEETNKSNPFEKKD